MSRTGVTPLSRLLAQGYDPALPVVRAADRQWNWSELAAQAVSAAAALAPRPEQRWCLYSDSSFAFTVGLLGLLHAGKTVVLPQNLQRHKTAAPQPSLRSAGTELGECQEAFEALLTDSELKHCAVPQLLVTELPAADFPLRQLDPQRPALELFTSGSTGSPKRVLKTLSNLEAELLALERLWGGRVDGAPAFSTVSHQHIYGLLFGVLWPLCTGRWFFDRRISFPEMLLERLRAAGGGCVVSSPAHLKRIPGLIDLAAFGTSARLVFSSGGPLPAAAARQLLNGAGQAPIEVLGSTETGGVAWRQLSAADPDGVWTPFDEVELQVGAEDGALAVASPFVCLPPGECCPMGDRARLCGGGRFELLGRSDGIVKIEGKRLSLAEMECVLLEHPAIVDAAVVKLAESSAVVAREELGAVVVLSAAGLRLYQEQGRRGLALELRGYLKNYFEPVLLPRRFRCVDAVPENEQGKRRQSGLRELFSGSASGGWTISAAEGAVILPEVLSRSGGDSTLRAELLVPHDLSCFTDHFPGYPVLPGFVQLGWAENLCRGLVDPGLTIEQVESAKFLKEIGPGDRLSFHASWSPERSSVTFEFSAGGHKCSSGRLCYALAASVSDSAA